MLRRSMLISSLIVFFFFYLASGIIDSGLRVAVVHRSSAGASSTLVAAQARLNRPTDGVAAAQAQLITLNEPFGQYFALMQLGSPPSQITVIIDTGSELLWVQCQPCRKCGSQILDPVFDPSASRTYRKLFCSSDWCQDASGLAMGCSSFSSSSAVALKPCFYNATYGDNSISYGELSSDTLTLSPAEADGQSPVAIPNFVFGCGLDNTGVETDFNASGLMGLDRGSHSLVSQLGVQRFSYCLPDRTQNIDSTGFLSFGGDPIHVQLSPQQQLQYTALLRNNKTAFYAQSYYLNLTGISVGQQLVDIPSSLFEIDQVTGSGGTIIDTGTSLTSLMDIAYAAFRDAVNSQVSGNAAQIFIPQLPSFDSCYTVPRSDGIPGIPKITFHFEGHRLDLSLPENNAWLQVGTDGDRNVYCLAFAAAGEVSGGRNVIGNFQQQNLLVEYDLDRGRIGFVHMQCSPAARRPQRRSLLAWLRVVLISIVFFLTG